MVEIIIEANMKGENVKVINFDALTDALVRCSGNPKSTVVRNATNKRGREMENENIQFPRLFPGCTNTCPSHGQPQAVLQQSGR